jgi:hypothetical protein
MIEEKSYDKQKVDLTAVLARERVCEDPDLGNGAIRLFVRVLDLSLNPDCYKPGPKGQVLISQLKLGTMLHHSERSIRSWTYELIAKRLVWILRVPRPNTKPIIRYHITEYIAPYQTLPDVRGEGMFGNCRRRHGVEVEATRDRKGKFRRMGGLILDRFGKPIYLNLPDNSAVSGHKSPLGAAEFTGASGRKLPVGAARNDRSPRQEPAARSGNNPPFPTAESSRSEAQPASDIGESKYEQEPDLSKGEAPPMVRVDWEKRLDGKYDRELRDLKKELTAQLMRVDPRNLALSADLSDRIEAIDLRLFGGKVPKPAGRPARRMPDATEPEKPKAMSEEELLESARAAIELGVKNVTKAQLDALSRAGEL